MMLAYALAIAVLSAASVTLLAWAWRARRPPPFAVIDPPEPVAAPLPVEEAPDVVALRREHVLLRGQCASLRARTDEVERELGALVYSISHDLRAPLRGIDGFSQALTEDYGDALDATAQEYLRRVRANAVHMHALIDDLLALARVVRSPFRAELVDVSALGRTVAGDLSAGEPARRVRWDIPANIVAVADRALLAEALRQLLSNAWRFTAGREDARIGLRMLPPDSVRRGATVYQVSDNGVGFDMQYAGKLFGAFQRMHSAEEHPVGRGIGLAVVQRIVHRHGGRVWAEAVPEQGATFSFTLERVGDEARDETSSPVQPLAAPLAGSAAPGGSLSTTTV